MKITGSKARSYLQGHIVPHGRSVSRDSFVTSPVECQAKNQKHQLLLEKPTSANFGQELAFFNSQRFINKIKNLLQKIELELFLENYLGCLFNINKVNLNEKLDINYIKSLYKIKNNSIYYIILGFNFKDNIY